MPISLGEVALYLTANAEALEKGLAGAEQKTESFSQKAGKVLSGALVGGATAAAGAVLAVGTSAVQMASEIETAGTRARTQLGLSAEEAARFEDSIVRVYNAGSGNDFNDIAEGLVAVNRQFERIGQTLPDEQLEDVTNKAFALRDAFGIEVAEGVAAVTALMDNFGITSDQAFGFVTKGFQEGLNSSDDFLDTIGEYSNQFAYGGASAAEFFSLLQTGMASGVLGTDKAADAFKEFNIRIVDDSDTTKAALDSIGVSYEGLKLGFETGSVTVVDAMQDIIDRLNAIEDPVARNVAGVALFGSQWEDLTETVILGLDTQKTGLAELETATADLSTQYETTQSKWETASRNMQTALLPIGESLMDMGTRIMPYVVNFIETRLTPAITTMAKSFADFVEKWNDPKNQMNPLWPGAPTATEQFFGGRTPYVAPDGSVTLESGADRKRRMAQENLAVINPANQLPQRPEGWVGAWNPNMGPGATLNVNVNATGAKTYEDGRQVGQGVRDELRSRGY